jgi:hypothetical protein
MTPEPPERAFPYRPKWTVIVLGGLFFAAAALILAMRASTNQRGVIIEGIIRLGPEGATTFYWGLAALGAGFVLMCGVLAYHRLTFEQRMVLGPTMMTVPASRWSRATKTIAYRDVRGLTLQSVSGQTFLNVQHTGGKYVIVASMLPSMQAFDEVRTILAARTG